MNLDGLALRSTPAGVRFDIRVTPRASRTGVQGVRDRRLVVTVTAPPVDRAANDAVVRLLAQTLDVPRRMVQIVAGGRGRNKSMEIAGLSPDDLRRRLQEHLRLVGDGSAFRTSLS